MFCRFQRLLAVAPRHRWLAASMCKTTPPWRSSWRILAFGDPVDPGFSSCGDVSKTFIVCIDLYRDLFLDDWYYWMKLVFLVVGEFQSYDFLFFEIPNWFSKDPFKSTRSAPQGPIDLLIHNAGYFTEWGPQSFRAGVFWVPSQSYGRVFLVKDNVSQLSNSYFMIFYGIFVGEAF